MDLHHTRCGRAKHLAGVANPWLVYRPNLAEGKGIEPTTYTCTLWELPCVALPTKLTAFRLMWYILLHDKTFVNNFFQKLFHLFLPL